MVEVWVLIASKIPQKRENKLIEEAKMSLDCTICIHQAYSPKFGALVLINVSSSWHVRSLDVVREDSVCDHF